MAEQQCCSSVFFSSFLKKFLQNGVFRYYFQFRRFFSVKEELY